MTLYPSTKSRWWMKKASATRPDPPYGVTELVDNHEPRQRQNRQTLPRRIPPGQPGPRRGRSPAPAGGESLVESYRVSSLGYRPDSKIITSGEHKQRY